MSSAPRLTPSRMNCTPATVPLPGVASPMTVTVVPDTSCRRWRGDRRRCGRGPAAGRVQRGGHHVEVRRAFASTRGRSGRCSALVSRNEVARLRAGVVPGTVAHGVHAPAAELRVENRVGGVVTMMTNSQTLVPSVAPNRPPPALNAWPVVKRAARAKASPGIAGRRIRRAVDPSGAVPAERVDRRRIHGDKRPVVLVDCDVAENTLPSPPLLWLEMFVQMPDAPDRWYLRFVMFGWATGPLHVDREHHVRRQRGKRQHLALAAHRLVDHGRRPWR